MTESQREAESWAVCGPLLRGQFLPLPATGRASAIDKQPAGQPVWLDERGLDGDRVADRRYHGGPERTLCHYPREHYAEWEQRFPRLRGSLSAAAFGENLSTLGLDEHGVCIGDRFRWGQALIEVSQPRAPCSTLEQRHQVTGLVRLMSSSGKVGWLYRTLESGLVQPGDRLIREQRGRLSVAEVWHAFLDKQLGPERLQALAEWPGLAAEFRERFQKRHAQVQRLRDQASLF